MNLKRTQGQHLLQVCLNAGPLSPSPLSFLKLPVLMQGETFTDLNLVAALVALRTSSLMHVLFLGKSLSGENVFPATPMATFLEDWAE